MPFFWLYYTIESRDKKHYKGVKNLLDKSKIEKNYFNIENYVNEE